MDHIMYELLKDTDKKDIEYLKKCTKLPDIKRFVDTTDDFFTWVTITPNESFYKIMMNSEIVGGLQLEMNGDKVYPAIWILPQFQGKGIAKKVVKDILNNSFGDYKTIEAGIEKENTKSLALFKGLGFEEIGEDGDIVTLSHEIEK